MSGEQLQSVIQGHSETSKKPVTPQVEPSYSYGLPSFVGAGHTAKAEPVAIPKGHWMNRMDVDEVANRYGSHPVHPILGKATKFLQQFVEEVDSHSDGWPYWQAPAHAAQQLMDLIQSPKLATEEALAKAMSPIKSFMTKRGTAAGMKMPEIALQAKEKAAKAPETGSTIDSEKPHEPLANQTAGTARNPENLPSVSSAARESGTAPTSLSTEGKRADEEERLAGRHPGQPGGERLEQPAGQPGQRLEPEGSRGSGAAEHPGTKRTGGRAGSPRSGGAGADGQPVESPTPQEPEEARTTTAELRNQRNFRISDEEAAKIGTGGEISKIKGNLDALETLKTIQKEGREIATPEEQATLAKYVDFGGLVGMLQNHWKPEYTKHYERFTSLLTPAEIQEIRETLPNTHYTSMQMVDWMWKAMQRMGFRGGRIIEPGMGIGNFMGRIPEKIANRSELYGVERNPLTGSMAKLLYPDANIQVKPFQHFLVPNNSLDAAIGNVPFQDVNITDDPVYKDLKLNLHNYFIVKTLDKLKPGGIAALITSRYTMDSAKGTGVRAREEMAKRADLVGAIRLPDAAFKRTAGTEVVADLLIFQKRDPKVELEKMPEWVKSVPTKVGSAEFPINQYFLDNPSHVLGEHSDQGQMYRAGSYTVKAPKDFDAALAGAADLVPRSIFGKVKTNQPSQAPPATLDPGEMQFAPEDVKPGAFFRDAKGAIKIKQAGVAADLPENLRNAASKEQIGHAIDLRDQLNRAIETQLQTSDDDSLKEEQKKLVDLYNKYHKKYGPLHGPKLAKLFGDDPEYPKLLALENVDPETKEITRAAIFTKRVLAPYEPLRDLPDDPKSAMLKVMAERGYLDTGLMAGLLKKPEADVIANLEKQDLIFQDPQSGIYHTADDYLSGNVREKLKLAEHALESDAKYARNVEALKKSQPKPLTIHDIQPNLGQTWIPMNVYKGFIAHLAKTGNIDVEINRDATGKWLVRAEGNKFALQHEWAGGDIPGHKLVQYAMNQQQPTVYQKDDKGSVSIDQQATTAAREKLAAIKEEFRTVLRRANQSTVDKLEQIYNDTFNAYKLREFSGEHLDFPGMSEEWRDKIRGYQKAAVWRILQEGRGGIFHAPGLGKTLTMAASGMEARRLKLSRKNMYAVPNHMVPQWREDFKRFYPNANVLAVTDDDFTATNRAKLMSRIATGDWDAVIVPHSQFDLLPMSPEWEKQTIDKRLADYRQVLEELDEDNDKRTIKQIEKAVDKLEARLNELNAKKKDEAIPFDQLGVDMLFVDEAHAYKAMAVPSKMGNVGGLSNRASQRAFALEMKADYLRNTHKGRGLVFGTGTPITNTVGELYVMTKYLAPEMLEAAGIRSFDDWAANFATTVTQWEYSPDGVTFKPKTTLSEFVNVPELSTMFRRYAEYLSKEAAKQLSNLKEPKANRKDHMVTVTPTQEPLLEMIADRGDHLTKHPPRTKEERQADNWLKLSSDARKISLDPRLYNPELHDDAGSKANEAVQVIKDTLDKSKEQRGTVVVFSDFFQHMGKDGKPDFNLFEDMKKKLVKQGVPAGEIAIIHEAADKEEKEALFARVRSGKVRVLFGSTDKMGIGTNVQDRLKAELHLDQPWRPDQVEQREGRIIRSGNMWDDVDIHRFIAEPEEGMIKRWDPQQQKEVEKPRPRAYDLQMYQQLSRKANFQEQFLTGNYTGRSMEDVGGDVKLNSQMFELAKAMATGNPDALRKIKVEHDLRTYSMLERNFQVERSKNTRTQQNLEYRIPVIEQKIKLLDRDIALWKKAEENEEKGISLQVGDKTRQGDELKTWVDSEPNIADLVGKPLKIGGIATELDASLGRELNKKTGDWFETVRYRYRLAGEEHEVPFNFEKGVHQVRALLNSFAQRARHLEAMRTTAGYDLERSKEDLTNIKKELERTSPYLAKVEGMEKEIAEINKRLGMTGPAEVDEGAAPSEDESEKPTTTGKEKKEGILTGESGSLEPAKAAQVVANGAGRVGDFLRQEVEDNRRAHELQWDLYDLDKRHEGRVLRAKQLLEGLQADGVTQEDRRAIDDHLDALQADSDSVPVPPLTEKQDRILDDVLMPMKAEAEEAFKKVTGAGMTIPNYNPRQTKGRGGMLDRFLTPEGEKRTGRGNTLSTANPASKHRVMMALENQGKRIVVSLKGGQVTAWDHGTPENLGPILHTDEGREFLDKDDNIWTLKQATKDEIEEHTGVEYYHDAAASTIVNWLQAKKAEAAHDFLEKFKGDPEFKQIAVPTDAGNPPKGWRTTNLPQMKGYYFEPHTAEVLDWFNDRLKSGNPNAFDSINSYMRMKILLNPIKHPLNVGAQWAVQKGVTGFLPNRWMKIGRTGARAINAIVNQNHDMREALDAGGALQSAHGVTRDLVKLFYDQMADGAEKGEPWATKLAKAVGLAPVELVKVLHNFSSKIAWPVSDMMYLQAAYEYQEDHAGVDLHEALREVGKIIPEYRLPTRIMDSRTLAKVMGSPIGTVFGAYHYGLLRSFSESAKSALGAGEPAPGRTKAQEVGKGWDRLAMMALGAFAIYAVADELARKLTTNKDATVQRHGIFGLIQAVSDVARKESSTTQAITKVMTPNPLTLGLTQLAFNRDLRTGRRLWDPAADWGTVGTQLMAYLKEQALPQGQQIERAAHSDEGWKKFAWNQADVNLPKHGAEKLAAEIASSKMDTSAWTPEERERYYARQQALEGLRRGDSHALEEGLEKGRIRSDELTSILRRSSGSPLYDRVHGFSYDETLRVYEKAVEDKDEAAQEELLPLLLEKQSKLMSQGRYEEAGVPVQ